MSCHGGLVAHNIEYDMVSPWKMTGFRSFCSPNYASYPPRHQKFDPCFISWNQQSPEQSLSAAAPSLHRFLARIPEPQIRVPNSAHLLLIAGFPLFSFPLSPPPLPSSSTSIPPTSPSPLLDPPVPAGLSSALSLFK